MRDVVFLWLALVAVEHHLAHKSLTAAALVATKMFVLSYGLAFVAVVLWHLFGGHP